MTNRSTFTRTLTKADYKGKTVVRKFTIKVSHFAPKNTTKRTKPTFTTPHGIAVHTAKGS